MIDDTERLIRMAFHLANDLDLHHRRVRLGEKRVLSEAARRAVKDLPAGDDVGPDGTVNRKAWRRLVKKFVELPPFFALDDTEEHGFDRGVWLA